MWCSWSSSLICEIKKFYSRFRYTFSVDGFILKKEIAFKFLLKAQKSTFGLSQTCSKDCFNKTLMQFINDRPTLKIFAILGTKNFVAQLSQTSIFQTKTYCKCAGDQCRQPSMLQLLLALVVVLFTT